MGEDASHWWFLLDAAGEGTSLRDEQTGSVGYQVASLLVLLTGIDFQDQGTFFKYQRLMGRGRIYLEKQGKIIFAKRLANLLRGAFN